MNYFFGDFYEKKNTHKIIVILVLILLLLIPFYFISGYRFTPMQATKSSQFIKGDFKVFGEVDRDWAIVYLLETQDGIKTATAVKRGIMWRCPSVTYFYDDIIMNDKVKTVGWESLIEKNRQITVFAVQTTDPDVKFIEAGPDSERQRKDIDLNETIIFVWEKAATDLNAIAYNQDNKQLYKYEYNPEHLNFTDQTDLRWYQAS